MAKLPWIRNSILAERIEDSNKRIWYEKKVKCYYEKEIDGFWFVMSRNHVTTNVIINGTIKMTELEQIVLSEIKMNPYVTREKMEKKYGRSSRTFQRALDNLKEKMIIERVGSHKTGYWKVLK